MTSDNRVMCLSKPRMGEYDKVIKIFDTILVLVLDERGVQDELTVQLI